MQDLGSRDKDFIDCVKEIRTSLLEIAKVGFFFFKHLVLVCINLLIVIFVFVIIFTDALGSYLFVFLRTVVFINNVCTIN